MQLPGDASIPADLQQFQYNAAFQLAWKQKAVGETNLYGYDVSGHVLAETQQTSTGNDAITLRKAWDKNGNELSITDWRGNTLSSAYDSLNRLISKTDAYGTVIEHLEYNHANLQTASENALGQRTLFVYDHNNRLLSTTDPASHVTSQTYDNSGNITTKTDGRNQVTTYTYDIQNRLVQVKNAKNEITGYTLDGNGNLLIQTDGNGHETLFEYNVRNLPTRRIDHGGRTGTPGSYVYDPAKTETYTYDAAGRMTGKTDRKGVSSTWQYDCHGRIVTETIGGVSVGKTWDDNGNLLTLTDSTGTTTCSYDALNRILTKQAPNVGTLTYGWNRTAGLQSGFVGQRITDSAGNVTDTILDRMGRIARVVAGTHTATYAYTVTGQQEGVTYETGCHEDYTYTADGLLETLTNKRADNTVIDSYAYTYDAVHNQTSKIDAKGTTGFTYDSLNRLLTLSEPNGKSTAYTYDAAGNRLTQTTSLGGTTTVETSTCNEQNRLTTLITRVNGTLTETRNYSWDNAGNLLLTAANGTNVQENAYDVRNQLVSTTMAGMQIRNVYNGEGLRVSKRTNGTLERYLLDGDRVVLELAENGTMIGRNVYGISLVMRQSGGSTYQFLYNGHADVTALVLPNGQIAGTWYYDAFGVPTEHTGVDSPYTYAGYRYDAETGLYYLNARMYDPDMARFLQEDTYRGDPNDPLSLNLYAYCMNNPIIYDDPTGHSWKDVGQFLYNSATTVADAASGYAYSAANMVMDTERTFLYEPLALAADTLGFGEVAKNIRGTVSQAQSGINASITANVTNETYFDTAKAGMDVAQFAYAAGGMAQVVGKAAMSSEKVAAMAGKAQEKIDILAQKVVQKGEASARELTDAAQKASLKLLTEQGGFARLPGGAGKATGAGACEGVKGTVKTGEKIPWGSWNDYEKVTMEFNGKQNIYAKIGNRLYSKHAVDRMQPSGNRYGAALVQAGGDYGRSVAPQYVEDVMNTVKPVMQENGNLKYIGGSLAVITNPQGAIVTVMTK